MTSHDALRRTPFAVGSLLALALVAGCAADGAEGGSARRGPAYVHPGTLTVCSDMPYEPFESLKDGKPVGFDIDLVDKVADQLGVKPAVKDTDFDAIQSGAALNTGKCDVAISAMTITGERARVVDFSSPYFNASQALVVDKAAEVSSLADLAGKKIAVQGGTTGELYVTDNAPKSGEVVPLKDAAAMDVLGADNRLGVPVGGGVDARCHRAVDRLREGVGANRAPVAETEAVAEPEGPGPTVL